MPDEARKGDSPMAALACRHWWRGSVRLPMERFGIALPICVFALFALLVSAVSPADDLAQPDFSRHFRNGHRIVTASNLLQMGQNRAAAITFNIYAGPVCHSREHSIHGLPACANFPGFEDSLDVRAPPACTFLSGLAPDCL